ncbi:Uncharacterized protein CK203_000821 [Vitis vinifera]|uniref:Uncharacterized protein n=1 Tax=Vitis vinifera TaxID=29760 RepID=A0A438KQ68_VITVI|nr:Uncharacterized protein CK203_000821 [Vitis vinifera]
MGGGNGQKSKTARERNMEKTKAAKGPKETSDGRTTTTNPCGCAQPFECARVHAHTKGIRTGHPSSNPAPKGKLATLFLFQTWGKAVGTVLIPLKHGHRIRVWEERAMFVDHRDKIVRIKECSHFPTLSIEPQNLVTQSLTSSQGLLHEQFNPKFFPPFIEKVPENLLSAQSGCKVCMQTFICTTSEAKCKEHAEAKHPKSELSTCFPI